MTMPILENRVGFGELSVPEITGIKAQNAAGVWGVVGTVSEVAAMKKVGPSISAGVVGESTDGEGVRGIAHGPSAAVVGINDWAPGQPGSGANGGWFESSGGEGVRGWSKSAAHGGVVGVNTAGGAAGFFQGDVEISSGDLSINGLKVAIEIGALRNRVTQLEKIVAAYLPPLASLSVTQVTSGPMVGTKDFQLTGSGFNPGAALQVKKLDGKGGGGGFSADGFGGFTYRLGTSNLKGDVFTVWVQDTGSGQQTEHVTVAVT